LSLRAALRRPLAALLIAALSILGVWGTHRLLRARAAAAAARILPADAILYLEAHDTAALLAALRGSPLSARHEDLLKSPLAGWLAQRPRPAALALWIEEGRSHLAWAVVSDLRGGERSILAALGGTQAPAGALLEQHYRGRAYVLVGRPEGETLCAGRIGRRLVVTSDETAYRRVVDVSAGDASLAGSGRLERGRKHLDAEGFLFAYLDASLLGIPGRFEGAAVAVRLGPAGWLERFHLLSDPSSPPLLVELLRRPPCATDLRSWLLKDADLLVSLCAGDLETLYEPALGALASGDTAAAGWRERLQGLEQLTGLNLKRELLGALGRRHAAAFAWGSGPRPVFVAALEVDRPSEFQQVLERLSGFGRLSGRLTAERFGARDLTTLADRSGAPALAWVLEGGQFLAAREPGRLKEALAARGEGHAPADTDWRALARRLAPPEVNLLAIERDTPALLWAVGRRDGVQGEVHAPHGILLSRALRAAERWREDQKPRAK
jgi:hypothetical protein